MRAERKEDPESGHAIWNGSISFGRFAVLVKLHAAVRERRIQFHLLHRRDLVKLKRMMVCSLDGTPVPPEEQAKGFELEGGKYVLIDPAELEKVDPQANRAIEVREFVPAGDIDPVFLERSYFLEPGGEDIERRGQPLGAVEKGDTPSERLRRTQRGSVPIFDGQPRFSYAALAAALEDLRLAGICIWTMRKRSYLGALVSAGGLLRLNTLRYAGEVVNASRLKQAGEPLSARELAVGSELIDHMTGSFKPEQFNNTHQERLRELIGRKARGQKIRIVQPKRKAATEPSKLLSVLEASLKKVA
jgi:DNA end-binding protein Ku